MSSPSYIVKALLTRLIFASHIMVSVWWVVQVTLRKDMWYLGFFDAFLFLETLFSLFFRRGQEYKWQVKPFLKPFFLKTNTLIESIYCQHVKLTVTRSNFMISAVATRAVAIKLMYSLRRLELRLHRKIIRIISDKKFKFRVTCNKYNMTFHSAN